MLFNFASTQDMGMKIYCTKYSTKYYRVVLY